MSDTIIQYILIQRNAMRYDTMRCVPIQYNTIQRIQCDSKNRFSHVADLETLAAICLYMNHICDKDEKSKRKKNNMLTPL